MERPQKVSLTSMEKQKRKHEFQQQQRRRRRDVFWEIFFFFFFWCPSPSSFGSFHRELGYKEGCNDHLKRHW